MSPRLSIRMHLVCCLLLWVPLICAQEKVARHNEVRQYGSDESDYHDCKQMSLTEPRWYIFDPRYTLQNYSTGGTHGTFGFTAQNMAMNQSFNCFATDVLIRPAKNETRWWNCTIPDAQFSFELNTMRIALKQSWVCNNAPTLKFIGGGNTPIPMDLGCGSDTDFYCIFGDTEIRARLESPLEIDPMEPWRPFIPYEYPEFCVQRSYYPTWEIDDLFYRHSPDRHFLSFNLTNLSNGKKIPCGVQVNESLTRGSAHEARWVYCDPGDTSNKTVEGGVAGTKVLFDRDYSLLGVQQTWQCRHNDTSSSQKDAPFIYTALGYVNSALNCTRPGIYDGSMDGSSADYTCTLPSTNISGYRDYDIPLVMPHTSYTPSCTVNSMNLTHMALTEYIIASRGGGGNSSNSSSNNNNASFRIFNAGPGDEYGIGEIPVQTDGEWHQCGGGQDSMPWQLASCEYLLDRGRSNKIGFRLSWYCDDRDPRHAATINGSFPRNSCKTTNVSDSTVTSCSLPAGSRDGSLEVSALNWTTTGKPMNRGPPLPWFSLGST